MKIVLVLLVLITGGIITGAIVAGPGLANLLGNLAPEPARTDVSIKLAERQKVVETVTAPGEIKPLTKVDIAAVVSAQITELPFREGDDVKKGDVVCRLDARMLKRSLVSAQAMHAAQEAGLEASRENLKGLKTQLDNARRVLERRLALLGKGGDISEEEIGNQRQIVDELEFRVTSTNHSILSSEAQLGAALEDIKRAQDGVDNTIIAATMDGTITRRDVEVGEVVVGSLQQPGTIIMTIADLSRMVMEARIAESDIADISVGQSAKVHINAYPDEVFAGTVTQIALQRSGSPDGTGFFVAEIEIDLQGRRIYSGLVANVDIEIKQHDGIAVPNQAIVYREIDELPSVVRDSDLVDHTKKQASVVYLLIDGKAVCTPVRTRSGAGDLSNQVVEAGLDEGDPVVVGPFKVLESLKHDTLLRDRDADSRPSSDDANDASEASDDARDAGEGTPDEAATGG